MKYNFDEIIDRRHTSCMNTDGFRQYIFHADENMKFPYADEEFIRMWIADMEFAAPDCITEGIKKGSAGRYSDTRGFSGMSITRHFWHGRRNCITGHFHSQTSIYPMELFLHYMN